MKTPKKPQASKFKQILIATFVLSGGFAVIFLIGCGNPNQTKLKSDFERAKYLLESVNRNPGAAAAYHSQAEVGGSIGTYLAASWPSNEKFAHFEDGEKPTQPWTIIIRETKPKELLMEAYGEDLSKPLMIATVTVTPIKTRE